ncbi:DoxX family membrane protein [Candidatus Saccharibacteria bacterium]|nr:DoxX family membrane protein [Candidatus Saccharibacteria bacterium]NIW79243.1 DoxX family membrane protein [Calditrichia bacterium]
MEILTTVVARVLFALPFAFFGLNHFMKSGEMVNYVPNWLPAATFWVFLTGLGMLAAAVSIIINKFAKWAGLGLAVLLLLYNVTIHIPGMGAADPSMAQMNMIATLKNTALLGAALAFAGMLDKKEGA